MSDPLSDAAASSNTYAQQQAARTIVDEAKEASDVAGLQDQINKLSAQLATLQSEINPPPLPPKVLMGISNNLTGGGSEQHVLDVGAKVIREDTPSSTVIQWAHANGIKVIDIAFGNATAISGDIVEGDNEPYDSSTWDVASWSQTMLAVAKAAKAAGELFLLPVGPPWNNGNVLVNGVWTDCVLAIDAACPSIWQYVDGISVHPYSQPNPAVPGRFPILDKWRSNLAPVEKRVGHALPFWITEFGWPTGGNNWPGGTYTEQAQADYYTAFFNQVATRTDVAAMIPYRLDDYGPRDTDSEHYFGIVRTDGTDKPAWSVVKARMAA